MKKIFNNYNLRINYIVVPLLIMMMFYTSNGSVFNLAFKVIIYGLICFSSEVFDIGKNKRQSKVLYILIGFLLMLSLVGVFFSKQYVKWVNLVLQIVSFVMIINKYEIESFHDFKFNKYFSFYDVMGYLVIIGVLIQFFFNVTYDGRSFLLSVMDSNYSAYYIFLFIILFSLLKKWIISALLIVISFKLYSRNFLICLVLFYLIFFVKKIRVFFKFVFQKLKMNFVKLSVLSLIFVGVITFSFIRFVNPNNLSQAEINTDLGSYGNRLANFIDGSNYARFKANEIFLNENIKNPSKYIFGYDDFKYKETVYNVPHNAFLLGYLKYGLAFLLCLVIYSIVINSNIFNNNLNIFLPIFVYISFLGLGLLGIDMVLLAILLKINLNRERSDFS